MKYSVLYRFAGDTEYESRSDFFESLEKAIDWAKYAHVDCEDLETVVVVVLEDQIRESKR